MQLRFIQEGYLKKQPVSLDRLSPEDIENKPKDSTEKIVGYLPTEESEHFLIMKLNGSVWFAHCLEAQLEHEPNGALQIVAFKKTVLKPNIRYIYPDYPSEVAVNVEEGKKFEVNYYYAANHPDEHCKVSLKLKEETDEYTVWYIYGPHFVLATSEDENIVTFSSEDIFTILTVNCKHIEGCP